MKLNTKEVVKILLKSRQAKAAWWVTPGTGAFLIGVAILVTAMLIHMPSLDPLAVQADLGNDKIASSNYGEWASRPVEVNIQIDLGSEGDQDHVYSILNEIEARGWRTTVFVTGEFAFKHPDVVKDIQDRGHQIAVHGWEKGEDLTVLHYTEQFELIEKSFSAIANAVGKPGDVVDFKPQGHRFNNDTVKAVQALGSRSISGLFECNESNDSVDCRCWYAQSLGRITFPYPVTSGFSAIPISTILIGSDHVPLDDSYMFRTPLTSQDYLNHLVDAYDEREHTKDPLVVSVHASITGADDAKLEAMARFLDHIKITGGKVVTLLNLRQQAGYITNFDATGPDTAIVDEQVTINVSYTSTLYCPKYRFRAYGRYPGQEWTLLDSACYYVYTGDHSFDMQVTIPRPSANQNVYTVRVVGTASFGSCDLSDPNWPTHSAYEVMDEVTIEVRVCLLVSGSGDAGRHEVVFVPALFDSSELDTTFANSVTDNWNSIANTAPFSDSLASFNVWRVNVLNDAGLNCHQNCPNLPNWANNYWCCNESESQALARNCERFDPQRDTVILLVDDTTWTGYRNGPVCTTGGDVIVKARNNPDINIHEFGHTFGLADEYQPNSTNHPTGYTGCSNCDPDSSCPKWGGTPACLQGCTYTNDYKPAASCMMNANTLPFCTVCTAHLRTELASLARGSRAIAQSSTADVESRIYLLRVTYDGDSGVMTLRDMEATYGSPQENNPEGTFGYYVISMEDEVIRSSQFTDPHLYMLSVTAPETYVRYGLPVPPSPPPEEQPVDFVLFIPYSYNGGTVNIYNSANELLLSVDVSQYAMGFIKGTVTDNDGAPVANAVIQASGTSDDSTLTDANGNYEMILEPGSYTVSAAPPTDSNLMPASSSATASAGQATVVDFTLVQAGSIAGTVIDDDGGPVHGAILYVSGYETPRYQVDENGQYVIPGLAAGSYTLNIDSQYNDYRILVNGSYVQDGTSVDVSVSLGETTVVDFRRPPGFVIQITDAAEDDYRPAIARTNDGKLWVVWHSWRSDNNIWYKTSDDNGVTWSADTQLTTDPSSDYDPAIVQASDGTIWVVWYSYRSGNADIWYKTSTDGGTSWSVATQLTTDANSDYSPAITQTSDSTIWVVWYSYRSGNADIWYKTSSDGGATWSSAVQLTTAPEGDYRPAIAPTSDGTIWVFWDSWRSDHPAIWYKTSSDGGASWSPDAEFSTDTNWDWMPVIVQTSDGTIWVARQSWSWDLWNWDIWYKTSSDGGTTWSADQQSTQFTGDDLDPGLAALPSDQVALVWHSDRAVNFDIWFGIIGFHGDVNPPPHLDEIEHDPWPNPDSNDLVTIRADVSDETGVASVILKWWVDGTPQADLTMYDDGAHDDYGADDGWYGVQIGPFPIGTIVEYQVEITDVDGNTILAPQYPMRFESLEPFVKTADILFVPDYGGYDTGWFKGYYENSLVARGYQYDVWDTGKRGEIDSTTLNQYTNGAVIWAVPYWGFVTDYDSTRNTLQSYLDNGGNLFITGQDIGRSLAGTDFYQNYLHADYVQDNIGLYVLSGVAGDPIGDGLSLSITGGDGANNQYSPDEIDPVSPAVTILTYSGGILARSGLRLPEGMKEREPFVEPSLPVPEGRRTQRRGPEQMRMSAETQGIISSGSGAIRVDTGIYKVIYFAFGFEGINGHGGTSRPTVLASILNWFGFPPPVVPVIAIDGYAINDDTLGNSYGNSDGIANPGEFLELYISLTNMGTGTAYGAYAVPSTSDPYVNPYGTYFFDDYLEYGDIAEGATITGDDFDFMISADAPDGHVIDFTLDIYDEYGDSWTDSFNVTVAGNDTTPPAIDNADVNPKYTPVGNPVNIIAFIREGGELTSVTADIESPDETVVGTITLHDDGNHNDGNAGDRWFGGSWVPTSEADFYVDFAATDDHGNSGTANNLAIFTSKPFAKTADILVVLDYGGGDTSWVAPYYTNALDALGYSNDVWDTYLRGEIDQATLYQYTDGAVVWAVPEWGYVTDSWSSSQANLQVYLDNGGKLFISGQDIGFYAGGSNFYSDYLHATFVQDDIDLYGLNGVSGDPISDDLYLAISGGDGANNQYYPSEIDPIAPAVSIFTYDTSATMALGGATLIEEERARPELGLEEPYLEGARKSKWPREDAKLQDIISSGTGAIRVDTGTYKVVYFAFGFEAINSATNRQVVMERVLDWTWSLPGDLDFNCVVNVADVQRVASRWRMTDTDPDWNPRYDLNGDGIINVVDIMLVVAHWGETCP